MAAHRYWRLHVTATDYPSSPGTSVGIAEIELRESVGGADVTGSGTASASFEYSTYVAAKCVDNNTATLWTTYTSTLPQWWAYDFGAGNDKDIQAILITPRQDGYFAEAPKTFDIQYSDNGTDWTTARSIVGFAWPDAQPRMYLVNEDLAPHDLTSDTSHSPFVVSSSSEAFGFDSWKAFESHFSAYWSGTGGGADTLTLDLGEGNSAILGSYTIVVASGDYPTSAPKDWTMDGSNNASEWSTLDTVIGETAWGAGEGRTFTCDVQTAAYRYFRLNISDNNGDATYTQVAELYLYEAAALGPRLAMFLR